MKANELTYGDWVFIPKVAEHRLDRLVKVKGIGEDVILFNTESGYDNVSLERVHPIPLTREILEANGWERIANSANGYWYPFRITFDLIINDRRSIGVIGDCEVVTCKYVHELQQALRVDGNEDLAENFEIE